MVGATDRLVVLVVAGERSTAERLAERLRAADDRVAAAAVEPGLLAEHLHGDDVDYVVGDLALTAGGGRRLLDVVGEADGVTPVVVTDRGGESLAAAAVEHDAAGYLVGDPAERAADAAAALEHADDAGDGAGRLESFVQMVGHDVRNPLAVARGWLDVYRESGDDDHYRRVDEALVRIEEILDDLEALARAEDAGVDGKWVGLSGVATAAWEMVDTGEAELAVEYGPELNADRTKFQEALENLLRNAVEHGADTVRVGTSDDGEAVYVADDGPGIPESRREEVFEPGVSTREDGTGLGLAIVDRVAAAHDWTARVTESEAGGARVELVGPAVDVPDDTVEVETGP